MTTEFIHLHLHTEFSIVDGLIRIKPLMDAIAATGMKAVAITDFCNLFAAVKFFKAAISRGIKPIIGCDLLCHAPDKPDDGFMLTALCQNNIGYKNLTCLISKSYIEGQQSGKPEVNLEWFDNLATGLIILSGGPYGSIGKALLRDDLDLANALAAEYARMFPNRFYLEIQRTGRINDSRYNTRVMDLSIKLNLPLVATNDVRFLTKSDFEAHEARVCIHQGCTIADPQRKHEYSHQQYLRSTVEMLELFKDLPQAISNTVAISKRCTVKLDLLHTYLPSFALPPGITIESFLTQMAQSGLASRLKHIGKSHLHATYAERLQLELNVINTMGFPGYFLIVADFIHWAREHDIPVGPGRGSGVGSLVAYSLKITDLDPLQYNLLFERFLNPERVSMPDFDIDFCMAGRDRVIEYVAEKYGRQNVSQIITFGTMAAKAVVRDVGRVLGYPYGFVDKIAKLIPFEIGMTLRKALNTSELKQLYTNEDEVRELIDLAFKLEGITRNAGKHAGGVVIAPSKLTDFTALYCEANSIQLVSQLDKDDVEAVGLVKFDFLGLRTLTIIDRTLKSIQEPIDISLIPIDDAATFELLQSCQTTAVFQLESHGMKELIHRLAPNCFEDIIALVALFRPGPLQSGMVDDFMDRKHGRAKVEYSHPALESILQATYGVILYQEQVMQITQVLANYTLGAADLLRRAMGKKKPEEMAKQRAVFIQGALQRDVKETVASAIFDLMEKFAGYGFNKSHAAAYALIAYQTAWLKTHYPAAFMAAVISSEMENTDKVVHFITESKNIGLTILPPSVQNSSYYFTVIDARTIRYGLGAIKGIGETAINCIVTERSSDLYQDLFDFCKRLDLRKVSRKVLELLIKSGSMDDFAVERSILFRSLDLAIKSALNAQRNLATGQIDLLALFDSDFGADGYATCPEWLVTERLQAEKDTLGLFLTGHPATYYQTEFHKIVTPINLLHTIKSKKYIICGLVRSIKHIVTKNAKKLMIITLEDAFDIIDVVIFEHLSKTLCEPIATDSIIFVNGEMSDTSFRGSKRMLANKIYSLIEARTNLSKYLCLSINPAQRSLLPQLQEIFKHNHGECPILLEYNNSDAKARLFLNKDWNICPTDTVINALQNLLGINMVNMIYKI